MRDRAAATRDALKIISCLTSPVRSLNDFSCPSGGRAQRVPRRPLFCVRFFVAQKLNRDKMLSFHLYYEARGHARPEPLPSPNRPDFLSRLLFRFQLCWSDYRRICVHTNNGTAHWHGLPARKAFAISSSLKQTCAEPLGIVRSIIGGCTQVFGASYYHNWSKPKGDARAYFRLLSWHKRLVKSQE